MLTGLIMLAAGLLRAGRLVRFIEDSVMVGFMAGVSVQIALGQLTALAGFKTRVLVDLTAGVGVESTEQALDDMRERGVELVHTA